MKWVVLQWPTKRLVCRSRCWHLKSVWHFVWIYLRARIYWGCPCGIIFAARSLTTSYYSWRESWTPPFFGTCRTSTSISPWSSCHLLETSPILGCGSMWESLLQRSFKLPGASCNTSWNTTWYDMIIRPFSRAELHRYLFIVNRHWYHWRHWYNWYHCGWAIYNDLPWYHHWFTVDNHWCTMIYHDYFQHPSAKSTDCGSKSSSLARLVALLRGDLAEPEAATGGSLLNRSLKHSKTIL